MDSCNNTNNVENFKNRSFILNFNAFEYIKAKFKRFCWKLNYKENYHQANKKIQEKMNITNILRNLDEFETLKKILFNEEEIYFFNMLAKPLILLYERKPSVKIEMVKENIVKEEELNYEKLCHFRSKIAIYINICKLFIRDIKK